MDQFLSETEKYIWLVLLLSIFILFSLPQFWDLAKSIFLFFKIVTSKNKDVILDMLQRLISFPPKLCNQIITSTILPERTVVSLDRLIRSYTITNIKDPIGINDSETGKKVPKYYIDLLTPCFQEEIRQGLAVNLSLLILSVLKKDEFDAIISPSRGNFLLGLEVSHLLGKPFRISGDIAGLLSIPSDINKSGGRVRYVIVDGIAFTGEEILHMAKQVHSEGADLRHVFVAIDRCFGAKDRIKCEGPVEDYPIELHYLAEYDDKKISIVLGKSNRHFNKGIKNFHIEDK